MTHILTSKQRWLFSLFLFFVQFTFSQNSREVSLIFAGDVMQHGPQIEGAYNKTTGVYEYDNSLRYIKPVLESFDVAIANLEVTHAGKPYAGYPRFSAPDELSYALKNAGFDLLLTSNNHSCDGGGKGVIRTLDVLDKAGVPHTGTFRNKKERDATYPFIMEKNGIKIAVLNYTYGTNGLTVPEPIIINYIDSAVIKKDIAKAKTQADYIICTMHWGSEYKSLPNSYQKNYENYCYELGADMVIGGHPHVIQPMEKKMVNGKQKLTAWSLGNFVSNQRDRYKNGGLLATAIIEQNANGDGKIQKVKLKEASYILAYVHKREEGVFKPYYILPEFDYNSLQANFIKNEDSALMRQFFEDSRALLQKHSPNIKESTLQTLGLENDYENEFRGYFSILVQEKNTLKPTVNPDLKHSLLSPTGKEVWLSCDCKTIEEARLNIENLRKLGESRLLQVVRVSPNGYKIIEE
jgi:poly-gamma-glutamate synthesis protein (capsule biosynthesis protein)